MSDITPEKAYVFRIVHVDNVPWILDRGGLDCRNSPKKNPNYVNIGNLDLIDKRSRHVVLIPPGGTLSDYVPFYFTPFSMMMYNIKTGYGGIKKRENREIVIFVSSVHHLRGLGTPTLFTNQHAYAAGTDFYDDVAHLGEVDWELLRSRNFKTDDADPGKQLRYQAEALVHQHVPLHGLLGIACYDGNVENHLKGLLTVRGQNLNVQTITRWYF